MTPEPILLVSTYPTMGYPEERAGFWVVLRRALIVVVETRARTIA
jgi:hypothetical protein